MKTDCEIIRDLLPLYADDACSGKSRELVEEHLKECLDCATLLRRLQTTEIESGLQKEKNEVIEYGEKRFKRRSTAVGTVMSAIFMVPILVCLIVNIATGHGLDWFFIVLAALGVAASLIIVPLTVPEDKLCWTFCAFCVSLVVLLAVVCLYTGGSWFWIASGAALFGLSVIFLPFAVKARPVRRLIGGSRRWLIVLGIDALLFVHMMNMIFARGGFGFRNVILALGVLAGAGMIIIEVLKNRGMQK